MVNMKEEKAIMDNNLKREFVDEFNAAELLFEKDLINRDAYIQIEHTILRTIIGHFAIELDKKEDKNVDA